MIRYLIKNNFKLMFRNTWSIVLLIVGPILVIAAVSSAFTELMKSYEGVDEFTVGYQLEQDSFAEPYMEMIFDAGKENGITFQECRGVQAEEALNENQIVHAAPILRRKRQRQILRTVSVGRQSQRHDAPSVRILNVRNECAHTRIGERLYPK